MFMNGVRALNPGGPRMVGQAFTMRYIPARADLDTLQSFSRPDALQRLALEACPSGYVLVIDARGDASIACAGDAFSNRLKMKGCSGIVTDGGLRDVQGIAALNFPAFLQAPASPPTFVGHHPADYDVPIGCGGVAVYPGDVVMGDGDGVVIIPLHLAETVAAEAYEIVAYDEFVDEKLAEGRSLVGLYPATDASREEYRVWRAQRSASGAAVT
jgi:regulator of RNase E activity RraA